MSKILGIPPAEVGGGQDLAQILPSVVFGVRVPHMGDQTELHIRPCTTVQRIVDGFREQDPDIRVFIPCSRNPEGDAVARDEADWQEMQPQRLNALHVPAGRFINFLIVGSDRNAVVEMRAVIEEAFNDGFSMKAADYVAKVKGEGLVESVSVEPLHMPYDADLLQLVAATGPIFEGIGGGSGLVALGIAVPREEEDYARHFGLCTEGDLPAERMQLAALLNVMTEGRTISARLPKVREGARRPELLQDIREGEAGFITGIVR